MLNSSELDAAKKLQALVNHAAKSDGQITIGEEAQIAPLMRDLRDKAKAVKSTDLLATAIVANVLETLHRNHIEGGTKDELLGREINQLKEIYHIAQPAPPARASQAGDGTDRGASADDALARIHTGFESAAAEALNQRVTYDLDSSNRKSVKTTLGADPKIQKLMKNFIASSQQVFADFNGNSGVHAGPTMDALKHTIDQLKNHNITTSDPVLGEDIKTLQNLYKKMVPLRGRTYD